MSDNEHAVWQASSKACESAPGAQGCVRRHLTITKNIRKTPCDYQWNSFDICKTDRSTSYKLNARQGKPYLDVLREMRRDIRADVVVKRESQGKSDGHRFFQFHFGNPREMLEKDPLAWNIDHTVAFGNLPPWVQKKWPGKVAENFLPAAHGGLGAMIPYNHNHHHLIPSGAFRDAVILGDGLGTAQGERTLTAYWRICIVRLAKYNINEKPNLCILPQQVHVSEVVGLPAHCPYGVPNHESYSNMVIRELDRIRETIDNAIGEAADHKALKKITLSLKALENRLWKRVQFTEPVGAAIGTHT